MFGAFAPMPLRLGDEWTAEQHARLCADLVALKRVMPTARWAYTKVGATVTISGFSGMQGSGPTWQPDSVTVNGTGDVTFKWTAVNFIDAYGVAYPLDIEQAIAHLLGATSGHITAEPVYNGVRIRTFNDAGSATDYPVSVKVW